LFINDHLIIVLLKPSLAVHWVHLPAGRHTSTQCAGKLPRFHHKGPVASKFAECKPNGLSHVECNVEVLLQA